MNWAYDGAMLSESSTDLERVFKYGLRPVTVVSITNENQYQAQVCELAADDDWSQWLKKVETKERGLYLVFANRDTPSSSPTSSLSALPISSASSSSTELAVQFTSSEVTITEFLSLPKYEIDVKSNVRRADTFAGLGEKESIQPRIHELPSRQKPKSLLHLPFTHNTFGRLCKRFRIHQSVVRTITRSDIPEFHCEYVDIAGPAIVYNCRTPDSWPGDVALSATYDLKSGVTSAILFGSSPAVEKDMLKRLQFLGKEASHPLLVFGMLVELELARHIRLVETNINIVEAKIYALDFEPDNSIELQSSAEKNRNNISKRDAWLNLSYLRNSLQTWSGQLMKMAQHADALEHEVLTLDYEKMCSEELHIVGRKIHDRLNDIRDEYDEKIRDCTMRVDGMAMATQWAQSETAVEIALATSQDSKVMRSISLITMIFLPGTFFATVFSMTFFDWSDTGGKTQVSRYLWVYVVITLFFTGITLGLWYYFVLFRGSQRRSNKEASQDV